MEYQEFAKYYDIFYQNKNYQKEVEFLLNFLIVKKNILDVGCGTGVHAGLLEQKGFIVDGLDLNKEMLDIAKMRIHSNLYLQDILNLNINKKYDVIISMFAVLNHLKDEQELVKCFSNLKNILSNEGLIIIDLHNPQSSGQKTDTFGNIKRTMEWVYNPKTQKEESKITFEIDGGNYKDAHTFRIFTIEEVKECALKAGLIVKEIYENYDIQKLGNSHSKNLQFILTSN